MNELVVEEARKWLGTPYHHQASVIGVGCDCLGLVRGVFKTIYGSEPTDLPMNYTKSYMEETGKELLVESGNKYLIKRTVALREIGNVVVFRMAKSAMAKHIAIVVENDYMIHSQEDVGCVEVSMDGGWLDKIVSCYGFPER